MSFSMRPLPPRSGGERPIHAAERLEPRIVLDGDWSAQDGADVFGSVTDGYLTVTTIDMEDDPIVFEQFDRNTTGSEFWRLVTLRAADDGLSSGTNFETLGRHSVAIHDEQMIIGAPNANNGAGAAAVFVLTDLGVWSFDRLLQPQDVIAGDGFGWAVDMHGDTAVIGTRLGNAAYVFQDNGGWSLQTTLRPTTGQDGRFGFSVATDGSAIAVGAPGEETLDNNFTGTSGAVYVYDRAGSAWTLEERVEPPANAVNSEFGHSVDVKANTLVVGAWLDDDRGTASGSVFMLGRYGGDWRVEAKFIPDQAASGARFGYDVATTGSRAGAVAIGADFVVPLARIFQRSGSDWSVQTTLTPDGAEADHGWRSIAFDDDRVIVGSTDGGGSARVFRITDGPWTLERTLEPEDTSDVVGGGFDVAAYNGTVLLGGLIAPGLNGQPVEVDVGAWVFEAPYDPGFPDAEKRWLVRGLGDLQGVNDPLSDLITWVDPKDGRTYAAMATSDGLVLFQRSTDSAAWTARNLTADVVGAEEIAGEISVFATRDDVMYIVGYNDENELLAYRQTGGGDAGAYEWTAVNITERDLRPFGFETPRFASSIVTFVTSWNALNIAGLDNDGRVQAVWIAPSMQRWRSDDLSASSGAAQMTGELAVFLTPWGGISLAGVDTTGDVVVAWWVPGFEKWAQSNFTDLFDGPQLQPESVTAYTTPWGALNVVGLDARGDLIVYWWAPAFRTPPENDYWRVTNLSASMDSATAAAGTLTTIITADSQINLLGTNESNDVVRYFWEPGDRWRMQNLTHLAEPF